MRLFWSSRRPSSDINIINKSPKKSQSTREKNTHTHTKPPTNLKQSFPLFQDFEQTMAFLCLYSRSASLRPEQMYSDEVVAGRTLQRSPVFRTSLAKRCHGALIFNRPLTVTDLIFDKFVFICDEWTCFRDLLEDFSLLVSSHCVSHSVYTYRLAAVTYVHVATSCWSCVLFLCLYWSFCSRQPGLSWCMVFPLRCWWVVGLGAAEGEGFGCPEEAQGLNHLVGPQGSGALEVVEVHFWGRILKDLYWLFGAA